MWYRTSQELLHIFSTSRYCKVFWHRCTFFASLASYRLDPSSQRRIMHIKSKSSALLCYATEFSKLHLNRIISSTNFNAQFNINMYVTLLSWTCFGPWHAHHQEEQLHKHSIWYPCSSKRLYTTPVESGLLFYVGISWCYLPCSACFVVPDCCVVLVQFYLHQIT